MEDVTEFSLVRIDSLTSRITLSSEPTDEILLNSLVRVVLIEGLNVDEIGETIEGDGEGVFRSEVRD